MLGLQVTATHNFITRLQETKFCEWLIKFGYMAHITTWEEDYKGNNTSPSLQSPLANSSPSSMWKLKKLKEAFPEGSSP
jgi:hypothetical protein